MGLSWLIYLIGFCESATEAFTFLQIMFFVITLVLVIVTLVLTFNTDIDEDERARFQPSARRYSIIFFCMTVASILIGVGIPSKETATMIAASEIGQRVLQSKEAAKVGEKLNSVIDPSVELLETYIKKQIVVQKQSIEDMQRSSTPAARDR